MDNSQQRSACCQAPLTVGGGRGENSTRYYLCTACKQATDPAKQPPERK